MVLYEWTGHCSGGKVTPTYEAWRGMKRRCDNPEGKVYDRYGGRGISYNPKWNSFKNFLDDMGECPSGLSLDRIDNNGNYAKENCRWATASEQNYNQRLRSTNTSGRKGVYYWKAGNKWRGQGRKDGKHVLLYSGPSFEDACKAREKWEVENGVPHYE